MKTVLLLGAGVSRAARPKIAPSKRAPLDTDFFQIAKAVNKSDAEEILDCLRSLVGDYAEALSQSLETATTYLYIKAIDSKPGSTYHIAFLKLLSLLDAVLANTTNPIPVGPKTLLYRFLLSELNKRELSAPEDLSIITFNYDLVLERILESISEHGHPGVFHFPGCYRMDGITKAPRVRGINQFNNKSFSFEGVSLLKLHGSMNWQSKHSTDTPKPHVLLNPTRELHILNIVEVPGSLSWHGKKRTFYAKPIIVPPISGKRGMMHNDVLSLWPKAALALREANRVIIAGYSCPPLDLEARILLSENMRSDPVKRVYVIDPNPEAAVKFLELCGVDHLTIYTSIEAWIRDKRP